MEEIQKIHIYIDDSGKLSTKEKISVYAGLVFLNEDEISKFSIQYKQIINQIKCKYCKNHINNSCNHNCPEIKSSNVKSNHHRWIMNYIKNSYNIACIINNNKVYDSILSDKASKGRYLDFALKMLIKKTVQKLINDQKIDPNKPLELILNIDEQTTKSNGYYTLDKSIYEELVKGIINFNYSKQHQPILYSDFKITLKYLKSYKRPVIQAADMLAGTIRREKIKYFDDPFRLMKAINFLETKVLLP